MIEHLAAHDPARQRFLRGCSVHGALLALSTAGGQAGERRLPLLRRDEDWDALADRLHELAPDLEQAEMIGLLDTVAQIGRRLRKTTAGPEGDALARALLARLSSRWKASQAPIPVPELEAWIALAKQLSPRPDLPPVGFTWAELLPTSAPDQVDRSSLERFADWLAVAELLLDYSPVGFARARLTFPGPARRFIDEFIDTLEHGHVRLLPSGKDSAIRALTHIRKLLPAHAQGANNALYWLESTEPGEPAETPTWTAASAVEPGEQTAGRLDVERVLRDL